MTDKPADVLERRALAEGNDQADYPFHYGHGRMPFFMKVVWVAFIAFITWYVVTYLIDALGEELG